MEMGMCDVCEAAAAETVVIGFGSFCLACLERVRLAAVRMEIRHCPGGSS